MNKITLNYKHQGIEEYSPVDITFELPTDITIDQFLVQIEYFLKACGFHFNGNIQLVGQDFDDEIEDCGDDYEPTFHDTLSTACCGLKDKSSPMENEKPSIDWDNFSKDSKWNKAEKMIKEWNEGIAKLDNEQKMKCMEEALKMTDLHYEATKEVVKNKWVHGLCNPPSPDWKKKK